MWISIDPMRYYAIARRQVGAMFTVVGPRLCSVSQSEALGLGLAACVYTAAVAGLAAKSAVTEWAGFSSAIVRA